MVLLFGGTLSYIAIKFYQVFLIASDRCYEKFKYTYPWGTWLSQLHARLLILAQVMVSWLCDNASHPLHAQQSLLLAIPLCPAPSSCSVVLSLSSKPFLKNKQINAHIPLSSNSSFRNLFNINTQTCMK